MRVGWFPPGYKPIDGIATTRVGTGMTGVGKFIAFRNFFGFRFRRFLVVVLCVVVDLDGGGVVTFPRVVLFIRITGVGHSAFRDLECFVVLAGDSVGVCGINGGPPSGRIFAATWSNGGGLGTF